MKNTGSPKGKGLGAPVATLSVALLILVAAFAYVSFSPKQATSTSSTIAPSSSATGGSTSATSTNLNSTSYSTSSTSSVASATTASSTSNAVTTFQSMPATSYPPAGTFDPNNGYIYVTNAGNGTVSVMSSSTNTVIAVLRVGSLWSSPSSPVLDPANGELFVSLESQNTVVIISGETVVATLPVGVSGIDPLTPVFDSQNGDIYVPTDASGYVSVISGATNTVVANVTVGCCIVGAAFDPANGDIYLAGGPQGGVVLAISGETNAVVGNLTLDFGPSFCPWVDEVPGNLTCEQYNDGPSTPVFDPANGDIYVSNGGGNTTSVISGATNSLVTNVVVGGSSGAIIEGSGAIEVNTPGPGTPVIDTANGNIYVTTGVSISVISSATNDVIANLKLGDPPLSPHFNSMNGYIYVPIMTMDNCRADVCRLNSTLSIISGTTNAIVATVGICNYPNSVFDGSNGDVYVSCQDGTAWVISSTTGSSTTTSTTFGSPGICGAPPDTAMNFSWEGQHDYMRVVTDKGMVITNGTLKVTEVRGGDTTSGWVALGGANGTGYVPLGAYLPSGYFNVTLVASYNNQGPCYTATIPSFQLNLNSSVYVTVSIPSGVVTIVTSNEGGSAVTTTTTTSATTIKNSG